MTFWVIQENGTLCQGCAFLFGEGRLFSYLCQYLRYIARTFIPEKEQVIKTSNTNNTEPILFFLVNVWLSEAHLLSVNISMPPPPPMTGRGRKQICQQNMCKNKQKKVKKEFPRKLYTMKSV